MVGLWVFHKKWIWELSKQSMIYNVKNSPSSGPTSDVEEPGERVHIVRCSLTLGKGPGNLDVTTP
jgi:hypothetical protein